MRGGKRDGAGRKREAATVIVPIRTSQVTRAALKKLAASIGNGEMSVGEMLTRLALDKEFRAGFPGTPD